MGANAAISEMSNTILRSMSGNKQANVMVDRTTSVAIQPCTVYDTRYEK